MTLWAGAEKLQPVIADLVAGAGFNLGDQCSQVIAFKEDRTAATCAN